MAGISPWQLLIVLLIVLLIFGTKKLRNVGGDLGSAIRDFRKGVSDSDKKDEEKTTESSESSESAEKDDAGSSSGSSDRKS